jgi:hypothetical protein
MQGLLRKPTGSCNYQSSFSQTPSVLSNRPPTQLFAQAQLTGGTDVPPALFSVLLDLRSGRVFGGI